MNIQKSLTSIYKSFAKYQKFNQVAIEQIKPIHEAILASISARLLYVFNNDNVSVNLSNEKVSLSYHGLWSQQLVKNPNQINKPDEFITTNKINSTDQIALAYLHIANEIYNYFTNQPCDKGMIINIRNAIHPTHWIQIKYFISLIKE